MKMLVMALLLFVVALPSAAPQHEGPKPTTMCFPVKADKTPGCLCTKDEDGKMCKDGKRMQESNKCAHFCFIETCACCKT